MDLVCALSLDPGADHVWPSAGRLSELLVLNEEMVEELTLEREGGPGASLLGIIGQHQQIAARLRAQLENSGTLARRAWPRARIFP